MGASGNCQKCPHGNGALRMISILNFLNEFSIAIFSAEYYNYQRILSQSEILPASVLPYFVKRGKIFRFFFFFN